MWLQTRMFLLIALLFGILYAVVTAIGTYMGMGNAVAYIVLAFVFLGLQYLISPWIVGLTMRVKYVTESEEPALHQMVADLADRAHLPKPRVGISQLNIPNAFAFGRTQGDGRICVTRGIINLLNKDELKAVLGHEMSHIKHRDMAIITLLSAIPMILYWVAFSLMWGGLGGRDSKGNSSYTAFIGIAALLLYFITNLLVLYGSRIREYYADMGSVQLGNAPNQLATALYKLVYGDARMKNSPEMKRVRGVRAFFVNDPAQAWNEVREISQIDRNSDGVIDQDDLLELRMKKLRPGAGESMAEIFSTHPNMMKRIKHLATLTV